jgi:hypothetical protein
MLYYANPNEWNTRGFRFVEMSRSWGGRADEILAIGTLSLVIFNELRPNKLNSSKFIFRM